MRTSVRWVLADVNRTSIATRTAARKHTKLKPKIMLHQNRTLFNNVLFLTQGILCTITIGICIIIIKNP